MEYNTVALICPDENDLVVKGLSNAELLKKAEEIHYSQNGIKMHKQEKVQFVHMVANEIPDCVNTFVNEYLPLVLPIYQNSKAHGEQLISAYMHSKAMQLLLEYPGFEMISADMVHFVQNILLERLNELDLGI